MRRLWLATTVLGLGLLSCRPAGFRNVDGTLERGAGNDDIQKNEDPTTPGASDSTPSSGGPNSIPPAESAPPPIDKGSDVIVVPPEQALKLACDDAKAKGKLQTKTFKVIFPGCNGGCSFGKNGNLSPLDLTVRARREESVEIPLETANRVCDVSFEAPVQTIKFDDEILITLNSYIIAASADFSVNAKDKTGAKVYESVGLMTDAAGMVAYKWLPPNGLQGLHYFPGGELNRFCYGQSPSSDSFAENCKIPVTETAGQFHIKTPQDAFHKLAVKAGLVLDKDASQPIKAKIGLVTTGDNDRLSDCHHSRIRLSVKIAFVPK